MLEIEFTLLNRKNKLMILTPIGFAAKDMRESIALNISIHKTRS